MSSVYSTLKILVNAAVLLLLSGCTFIAGEFEPNTQFAYPNSNVTPVGPVAAEVTRTKLLSNYVDQQMLDEVLTKAMREKGADGLINYKLSVETTSYPIPFIYTTTLRVSGTAVKMTIGKQELH